MTRRELVIETLQELAEEAPFSIGKEQVTKEDFEAAIKLCQDASKPFPEASPDSPPEETERISDMLGAHLYSRDDFTDIEAIAKIYYILLTEISV